jgi:NO-binding membrane sensor protein with MHYT domain
METFLWACQILLAISFLYSGFCKAFLSKERVLSMGQTGVRDISLSLMRFIGMAELLGVAGILLPWSLHVLPVLTPVTAVCFAVIMVLAGNIHYRLGEPKNVMNNVFLFVLAVMVAYFRFTQL